MDIAYVDENDNAVKVIGLRDDDGEYVNDATVACTDILDSAGASVAAYAGVLPIAMAYVTGSEGEYRGTFSGEHLAADETYTAVVDVAGGGLDALFKIEFTARTRAAR